MHLSKANGDPLPVSYNLLLAATFRMYVVYHSLPPVLDVGLTIFKGGWLWVGKRKIAVPGEVRVGDPNGRSEWEIRMGNPSEIRVRSGRLLFRVRGSTECRPANMEVDMIMQKAMRGARGGREEGEGRVEVLSHAIHEELPICTLVSSGLAEWDH